MLKIHWHLGKKQHMFTNGIYLTSFESKPIMECKEDIQLTDSKPSVNNDKIPKSITDFKNDLKEDPKIIDEDFASTTSLHGIAHFIKNKSIIYKGFWGLVFFTCMGVCIWQITDRVSNYFSYPSNRAIDLQYSRELSFPAVTICRVFRYNQKNISNVDKNFFNLTAKYLKGSVKIINASEENELLEIIEQMYKSEGEEFNFTQILLRSAFTIDKNTLKDCKFGGKRCEPKDFKLSFNHKYQFCWTFNGGTENLHQNEPGSDYGFKFSLDLKEDEYDTPFPTGKIGFKLFFHPPGDHPYIFGTGHGLGPGLQSRATISFSKNINLVPPHGKCNPNRKLNGFAKYSLVNCLIECKVQHLISSCGCRPIYYEDNTVEVCDFIRNTCLQRIAESKEHKEAIAPCEEKCEITCVEESFEETLSYVQIVFNKNLKAVMERFDTNISKEYLQKNYAFLNAYYENFVYVLTEQSAAITASSLVSDIGGQLGLFMGMSTLTMIEVFEYFGRRMLSKIAGTKKQRQKDENEEAGSNNYQATST